MSIQINLLSANNCKLLTIGDRKPGHKTSIPCKKFCTKTLEIYLRMIENFFSSSFSSKFGLGVDVDHL